MSPDAMPTDEEMAHALNVAASLNDQARGGLLAALVFTVAIDTRQHPLEVLEAITWPTREQWDAEHHRLGRIVRNARAMYATSAIVLQRKRPQG